jgi:hypothetical protein
MGGGGSYYDRDTRDGYTKTSAGYSKAAEELMSSSSVDKGLLPKDRTVESRAKSPVVYAFDVTGSMDNLPMIIVDKMPLIAGQIAENGYLDDPEMSIAAIGDIERDKAPIQVGDFTLLRNVDDWFKRVWRENGGGGNDVEGYEHMAYYYARYCRMPSAETPFFLFTGDEGVREMLYKSDLERHFGGTHETISAKDVFKELDKKFKNNVFLIHRYYSRGDDAVLQGWRKVLPDARIIRLGSDLSIGDVTLGLLAVMTGSRTLDEYCEDMKTKRDKAQTEDRIAEVRESLAPLLAIAPSKKAPPSRRSGRKGAPKRGSSEGKAKGKKPGRF